MCVCVCVCVCENISSFHKSYALTIKDKGIVSSEESMQSLLTKQDYYMDNVNEREWILFWKPLRLNKSRIASNQEVIQALLFEQDYYMYKVNSLLILLL